MQKQKFSSDFIELIIRRHFKDFSIHEWNELRNTFPFDVIPEIIADALKNQTVIDYIAHMKKPIPVNANRDIKISLVDYNNAIDDVIAFLTSGDKPSI